MTSARRHALLAATLAALFTAALVVEPGLRFAYRSLPMHVALETAATLIALLTAQLLLGRFRRSLDLRDLVLAAALAVLSATNLCFSLIPAVAGGGPGGFATWAPVGGRLLGASLFMLAALMPQRRVRRRARAEGLWLTSCLAALILHGVAAAVLGDRLPEAVPPDVSPERSGSPFIVGSGVVLALQVIATLLYAAAAVGFLRRAERTGDALLHWFAVGAVLAASAGVNYALYPSLYSEWFYAGDVLRLGSFLCLLAGGLTEVARTQGALAGAAVLEERRRVARDLHDGMAQDLAFIVQFGRGMARRPGAPRGIDLVVTAAERALDDSRHSIAALVRPSDEPLDVALERTAREAASREGANVESAVTEVALPERTAEALLRIVREAVSNAARHGHARTIRLELLDDPALVLRVSDDGQGFDVAAAAIAPGHHGLTSMRERVHALGGEFDIRSSPGAGSVVEVRLP